MSEEIKTAFEEIRYIEGILMGLFLGILGNLCVSFLIETIHAFGTTFFYTWLVVFILSLGITVVVSLVLIRRIIVQVLRILGIFDMAYRTYGREYTKKQNY